jgi:DNA repair exonuclease SbcCD ATPase subunit
LSSLRITGFTGVSDSIEVDLDASVIVLQASNGFGKSTLCNAIAWALTGVHPRGADPRSLYSRSGETHVSLTLSDGRHGWTIQRLVTNPGETKVEDLKLSLTLMGPDLRLKGAQAEAWLVDRLLPGAGVSESDMAAMSGLLTDSYFLQQETLREFLVSRSDTDRFSALSRMVGAGSLTDLVKGFESAKGAWVRATTAAEKDLAPLREQLDAKAAALEALEAEFSALRASDLGARVKDWLGEAGELLGRDMQDAAVGLLEVQALVPELRHIVNTAVADTEALLAAAAELQAGQEDAAEPALSFSVAEMEVLVEQVRLARQGLADVETQLKATRAAAVRGETVRQELAAMAELALRHVSDHCPACGQSVVADDLRQRLQGLQSVQDIAPERGAINDLVGRRDVVTVQLAELEGRLGALQQQEREYTRALAAQDAVRQRRLQRRQELQASLGLDALAADATAAVLLDAVQSRVQALELRRARAANLLERSSSLRAGLQLSSSADRLALLQVEVQEAQAAYARASLDVNQRRETATLADSLLKAMKRDSEAFLTGRLEDIQPVMDQLYSAIDPHPTFRSVRLAVTSWYGKNRLAAVIRDETDGIDVVEPGNVLSTSQANALAVTLFLGFNLGLNSTSLETLVLDDPLQNLDDVHLLGLVDLLRRISPYRQLLITTHDNSFATLLGRKMRPLSEGQRLVMVRLTKWDRAGPTVDVQALEADPQPLKLASQA